MFKILKLKIIILLAVFIPFLTAVPAFAAEIRVDSKSQAIGVGQQFQADLVLDTEGEEINAVEGKIIFPKDTLELKEIQDGNSIINLWIEKPGAKNREILFSGIIPGGYSGKKGLIFSAVFQSTREGRGLIEIQDIKILLNDGKGTAASTIAANLQIIVSRQSPASQPVAAEIKDFEKPEAFEPIVTSNPAIFGGKYFLVFATQDKGSGIDYYKVREGNQPFVIAESPYLLQNQNLDREITVRAIDKSGNVRVATLPLQKPLPWYQNYWILAIIIIGLVVIGVIIRKILWLK